MTTYAYLRVSTDEQTLGLDAQRHACEQYAARNGDEVAAWFVDEGMSGGAGVSKRLGLLAALDRLKPGDVLLVAKRDRLVRGDVLLGAWIEKEVARRGARIVSAAGEGNGSDPTDVLLRRVVDAFSEFERLTIRARTKAALARKKARGEKLGGTTPYGFDVHDDGDVPRLRRNWSEQRTIRLMLRRREAGASLRTIAEELNDAGTTSKAGGQWHPKTVRAVLIRAGAGSD